MFHHLMFYIVGYVMFWCKSSPNTNRWTVNSFKFYVCLEIIVVLCSCHLGQAQVSTPTGQPISLENAKQVKSIRVFAKRADRLERGPREGQWLIEARELVEGKPRPQSKVELIGGMAFQPIRPIAPNYKPEFVVCSRDGKRVAFKQQDKEEYIISELDGGDSTTIKLDHSTSGAAFSPDGKLLAIGCMFWEPKVEGAGYSTVRLYNVDGRHVRDFDPNGAGAIRPVFSPDGKLLAAGNRNYGTQIFDVKTGKLLHQFGKKMTQEHAFSPDGKWLAEGYVDGTVAIWDVASGKMLHSSPSGCKEIYSVDWNPSGKVLATSGRDGNIVLWDTSNLKKLQELKAPFWVIRVRFSRDGAQLVTASASNHSATEDRKITFWAVCTD